MSDEGRTTVRQATQRRRTRTSLSVLSWSTVIASIAGFFAIWQGLSNTAQADTTKSASTSSPSVQSSGANDGLQQGTTPYTGHRHHHRGSLGDGQGGQGTYGSGSGDQGSSGDGDYGFFGSDPGAGQGSVGISPSQTPNFGSHGS